MKKKILLLKARTGMDDPSPPMAFSYLSSVAKECSFEVLVENLNAQYNEKTNQDIIELIKKEDPFVVGIHIFTNATRFSYGLIKEIRPFCKIIIAGGPHPTICPEEVLENGVDIAVIGEAEISFRKLLETLSTKKSLRNVRGIVYKEGRKIIKTKQEEIIFDLDEIPMPDKSVHRKSDYVKIKEEINNFGQILSTRGCPGRCTYCFSLFNKHYRTVSAKKVFDEILYLKKVYGINFINFIDDAFTINKKRLVDLCDLLISKKVGIHWSCATRVDFLNEELIIKMRKAGCKMINFGVESAIPKTLINMKKTANPEWYIQHTDNLLKWCYRENIRVAVNILTGFPWESAEDMKEMQRYVNRTKRYVTSGFYGGILQPQPGTEMYEKYAKEYGFEKWWLYKQSIFKDDYRPFFMVHYHQYWDHLQNNFFDFDSEKFREIDKLYKLMGKWNLYIFTKRRFKNYLSIFFVYQGVFILSKFSELIYSVSPHIERRLMERVKKFSYRFKFREGKIK